MASLLSLFIILSIIGFYLVVRFYRKWQTRQTRAFEMGGRQVKGDMYQLLGTFASLEEYEQIVVLATTSKQASLDLIGVTSDELHFLEFKKKGSPLQTPERKIKRLIDEKKVRYIVKDVELPERFQMEERE